MRPGRIIFALLAVLALVTTASSYASSPLVVTSGPSPFASCTAGGPGTAYTNAEVEPWLAVNPANPSNLIGVVQQDRWNNGGARGLTTMFSNNGGFTWSETAAPFSLCSGGSYDRASDPWVTFSPNGTAYQIALAVSADTVTSAILVSRSFDGGATWSQPVTLLAQTSYSQFNDKESITADPANPNYVYAVWDRSRLPADAMSLSALNSFAFRGDIMFSRTTNGGLTWEPARAIYKPRSLNYTIANQIVVLPDGTLIDMFARAQGSGINAPGIYVGLIRSTDHGATWSAPMNIDHLRAVGVTDPDTGHGVRTGDIIPDIAVDPATGKLAVVWQDSRFSGGVHDDIAYSESTDGGFTWSPAIKVNRTPAEAAAFTAAVHFAADGTVGVSHYDFRNNTPDSGLPTDYWFVHCHSDCANAASWTENHVAGPFDMETAPDARGYFVGDYEGLASIGNRFALLFVAANSGNTANRTDVFFTTVGP